MLADNALCSFSTARLVEFTHRQDMLTRAASDLELRRLLVCDEIGNWFYLNVKKLKQIPAGQYRKHKRESSKAAGQQWCRTSNRAASSTGSSVTQAGVQQSDTGNRYASLPNVSDRAQRAPFCRKPHPLTHPNLTFLLD